jgi:hypothetical protein
MKGGLLVILWLVLFSVLSYFLCTILKLQTTLLRTIFVWTLLMAFVAIFETMLLFYSTYMQDKGKEYYKDNTCYWTENKDITDMLSYKMYMELYSDYSLSDKRYCKRIQNQGSRFVLLGELTHGAFCILFVPIIFYYFIHFNELYIYLYSIIFVAIQFALIIWYLASVFVEMYFVKNDKFWFPPLLWNVPWVLVPIYVIYYSIKEIDLLKYIKSL